MDLIRLLLLADTHLGFDDPVHPKVVRRRRGPDFHANYRRALAPARRGDVDLVVHGGDLFFRSRIPAALAPAAFEPLARVAARGVGVFAVPGNHERGRLTFGLLAGHPGLNVFDRPRTYRFAVRGVEVAVGGFPFARDVGAEAFAAQVHATSILSTPAELRLLCMHQAVEGAQVGPRNFTFRPGTGVVAGRSIPAGLAAVLTGHVHRAQVLTHDLDGRRLAAPVIYPGATERTAFAEREEAKGYQLLAFEPGKGGGRLVGQRFVPLPARPMVVVELDAAATDAEGLRRRLCRLLAPLPVDAVVKLVLGRPPEAAAAPVLSAPSLRAIAPPTMNVELAWPRLGPTGAGR